ncbi:MAG: endolytic transglycosylase MltG [Alphaproteobacteria bacterium]|nr:endolytic transglycosylase MltG [Alphaproteobacteria bacterium]MBQ3945336.1 endolytic transglycosylase MltG [Alphaproteobacteria bacterium]
MHKLLLFIASVMLALSSVFFVESKRETHSVFYVQSDDIYEQLENDKSFTTAIAFYVIEKIPYFKKRATTGEYEIRKGESVISVMKKMLTGNKVKRKITIPEGYTVKQIIENLNENHMLFGDLNEDIQEGTLFPDTYFYSFGDTKKSIIYKMQKQMEVVKAKFLAQNKTSMSLAEIIILASIIEKESGNSNEYHLISSVFHNRLARKMRLQSDPTVIYALTDGYGKMNRKLKRADLQFMSPYNTYRNAGLPPSPICCPGEKAIKAAMSPDATEYFYFVANKEHTAHTFSKEYTEHLRAIKKLRSE